RPMTEAEWLTCPDPDPMLRALQFGPAADGMLRWLGWGRRTPEPPFRRASPRQLRLYACACCHRIADLMADERSRRAVEVAQLYADGEASDDELAAACEAALDVH